MRPLFLTVMASLAACVATETAMPYAPTVSAQAEAGARPVAAMSDRVANEWRAGRDDPTWIGSIRGGYGNPMEELRADAPVDRVVARAFADGLRARGLLASGGGGAPPCASAITIHQSGANQYGRREATADSTAAPVERATGRELWRDRSRARTVEGGALTLAAGVFGSADELRGVALRTMSQAVDALLDDPAFRAALRRG